MVQAIMAAIGVVTSAIFRALADGDRAKAQMLYEKAIDEYGPEVAPELDRLISEQQDNTEFDGVNEDPRLRSSQLNALRSLENEYQTGGMTDADKAAMRLAQDAVSARAGSDYSDINQMLARRGQQMGGMGAAALYSQAGGNAAHALGQMGGQNQIAARDRALRALEAAAGLAGDVRGQDYRVSSDRARAQDAINAFNTRNRQDTNVFNSGLQQQDIENQVMLKDKRNHWRGRLAGQYNGNAERLDETGAGFGQASNSLGAGWGGK